MPSLILFQQPINRAKTTGGADVTAPTVTSATIDTAGTSFTLNLSENVVIGAGGNGGLTITASGGAASLTYSSGSGSSALVYTIGRTIGSSETVTRTYVQPGNGIEDTSGNDLASFTTQAVTNNSSVGASVYPFPLTTGHAIDQSNITMVMEFPRPNTETASYERNRLHPSGVPMRIPVGVRGGIPPYRYTISSDMSGLTIGQDMPTDWFDNGLGIYGVMTHTNPVIGSYTTTLTATDQVGTAVSVSFAHAVVDKDDTTKFRWYDFDNGSNGNTGTYSSPYKDNSTLAWGSTTSSTTFQGQVWYKPSTSSYPLTAHSDNPPVIQLKRSTRPVVMCGMPTTVTARPNVTMSFLNARFSSIGADGAGFFFGDINCADSVSSGADFQYFRFDDSQDRITFYESDVSNIGTGTSGTDNSTFCNFVNGATGTDSTYNHHVFFRAIKETGRGPGGGNSYGITSAYGIKGFLFENCLCVSSSSTEDLYLKDSCTQGTVRYCKSNNASAIGGQNQNGGTTGDIEYVHCVFYPGSGSRALTLAHEGTSSTVAAAYVSRCTLVGYLGSTTLGGNGPFRISGTIIQTSGTPVQITTPTPTNIGTTLQGSGTYVDASNKITSGNAAQRGLLGAEIFN